MGCWCCGSVPHERSCVARLPGWLVPADRLEPAGGPVELPRVTAPAVPRAWIAQRVVQMRADGFTAAQIADALSISKGTVWAMLREHGRGREARLPPACP